MKFNKARLKRFPRVAYWIAGAVLACAGAVGARLFSETFPLQERIPIWLAGAGVVFLGLCVVSLGTRAHLEADEREPEEAEQTIQEAGESPYQHNDARHAHKDARKGDGAGEGNRTLA